MSQHHSSTHRRGLSMDSLTTQKKNSLKLAHYMRQIAEDAHLPAFATTADRVQYCATFWQGFYCPTCRRYHHMHTSGCHHRLCPICATRASRVIAAQALEAISIIRSQQPAVPFLLTLTQRNVSGDDLSSEIDKLLVAWGFIQRSRLFKQRILGYARTIEIVPALHDEGMYHPHIHAILLVRQAPDILPAAWFAERWKSALSVAYTPIVDLRPITDKDGAVAEISKYISKMSRIYDGTPAEYDHVLRLALATYNRRLRTYGGAWAAARRELNQTDVEQMDDDAISRYDDPDRLAENCPNCGTGLVFEALHWAGLRYERIVDSRRSETTPEENLRS